jgi:uncharacterized protein (TIGR03437 family)
MPTQLGGVSVTVNNKPGFVYFYCSAATDPACPQDQLNILTPLDNTVGPVPVVVTNGSVASPPFTVTMGAVAPSFLLFSTAGYIAATHANGSLLGPASLYPGLSMPAEPGETVVLYAVGFGLPATALMNGSATQTGPLPVNPICKLAGNAVTLNFAGLISPGLYQLNIVVPISAANGDNPVSCAYGGSTTPSGALITVQSTVAATPTLLSLTLTPVSIVGGKSATATVTLSSLAPAGGVNVTLQSDNAAAQVPAPPVLSVAGGQTAATFPITTTAVTSSQTATITASLGASIQKAALMISPSISASYTVLHSFSGTDGSNSESSLIQGTDGYFYGTTQSGGALGLGAVFKMDSSGHVTILHSFSALEGTGTIASLVQGVDGNFYGTAITGGAASSGTIFKMSSAGNVTVLHSFSGADGAGPAAPLIQARDGYFYGTTALGGNLSCSVNATSTVPGCGTIFKIDSAGNFTSLHSFTGPDGLLPVSSLLQANDGSLYGTVAGGGTAPTGGSAFGTIFRMNSAGVVTVLHSFGVSAGPANDGGVVQASVVQGADGNFYGTTSAGGNSTNSGTVFKMDTSGNVSVLHSFSGPDGAISTAPLIQASDGNFYGTTQQRGNLSCTGPNGSGCGALFKMDLAGNVSVLNVFSGQPADGSYPHAALIQGKNGFLYGTTQYGGPSNDGIVFQLSGGSLVPLSGDAITSHPTTGTVSSRPLTGKLSQWQSGFSASLDDCITRVLDHVRNRGH